METAPKLPALKLADLSVEVDGITGHGASRANLSVSSPAGTATGQATREQIVAFAIELLALSGQMIEEGAYGTSDFIRTGTGHVTGRHHDGLKRYYRIRDRLPILQLAQRVLEATDDATANTLLALLVNVEATGKMPIKIEIDFKAAKAQVESASQKRDPSESKH